MPELQMRVSDQERERAAQLLQAAFAEGRLSDSELDERLGLALTAKTFGELAELVADLPTSTPPDEKVVLESGYGPIRRAGDWAVPRRLRVCSPMGSAQLDLSEAVVAHPVVDIEFDLTYGAAEVILPEGATADVDGFTSTWGRIASAVPGRQRPGVLHVRIVGQAKYGQLRVRYRRKRWFTQ
jgi:hypothetical protein